MELVRADSMLRKACEMMEGRTAKGEPVEQNLPLAERLLNELLDNNIGNLTVLYTLASLHLSKGHAGLAIQILSFVVQRDKNFGEAWNNLGLAYKEINQWEKAAKCAIEAAKLVPHPDIPTNVAACHLNRGMPDIALQWADKALALDPNHSKAKWHKAMALLELSRWEEAWDWHESRLEGGGNYNIAPRNYHADSKWREDKQTPYWDGKAVLGDYDTRPARIVIHGEQGMGDEIMFASCIPDVLEKGVQVIFEPSPRLEGLFKRSFPAVHRVHGTDETNGKGWIAELGEPDYMCALGSLPKFYRRSTEAFPGTPYLVPDPKRKALCQARLWALGQKPKVGIAWQGGVHSTRQDIRSFHPRLYEQLYRHDVDFISLQYDQTARANVEDVQREFGVDIHHWPEWVESVGPEGNPSDMDDLAALISCLDLVITVPQTCYHVAGGLGIPCWVLTQSEPDWRLGITDDTVPWYNSVSLIRQPKGTRDWMHVIRTADARLEEFLIQNGNSKKAV